MSMAFVGAQTKFQSHETLESCDKNVSSPYKPLKPVHSLIDINDMTDSSTI